MNNIYSIIYENDDFIIINKHSESSFHSENGPGLFHMIQENFVDIKLFPVHRLDRYTTGLMIIAKSRSTASEIGKLIESHQIEKFYIAVSDIRPNKMSGRISGDMKKTRRGMWSLKKTLQNPAVTDFKSYMLTDDIYFFIIQIHTGKTHQVRVAMKSLGSPIIGDRLYYPKPKIRKQADRMYLHSYRIKFVFRNMEYVFSEYPASGEIFTTGNTGNLIRHILETFSADNNVFLSAETTSIGD